jgi:hypothetical protein
MCGENISMVIFENIPLVNSSVAELIIDRPNMGTKTCLGRVRGAQPEKVVGARLQVRDDDVPRKTWADGWAAVEDDGRAEEQRKAGRPEKEESMRM